MTPPVFPLVGVYLLYFGTIGILLPFLPAFLRTRGLTVTEVGLLLAIQPAMALLAPPFFGRLADRSGRPSRVLALIALGCAIGFAPLLLVEALLPLALTLVVYGIFASSVTPVLDSIALHRVATHGGAYAHLRLFGSLGFVISSALFGLWVEEIDRATVLVPVLLMLAWGALSFALPSAPVSSTRPRLTPGSLPVRELGLFLIATALHWIALAPFHGTYALYVEDLGLANWVVGASAALGVLTEIGVMLIYPRFADRFTPRRVLAVVFLVSALRWVGYSFAGSATTLLLLALLHGLTFGAFYVAAVGFMVRRVPVEQRAQGQAAFASMTFGVGGLVGYLSAGAGYDLLGGPKLFLAAAVVELIAAAVVLSVGPPKTRAA